MKVVNSLVEDFGDFELDATAIELRSASDQDIMLPYRGELPKKMSMASSAHIYLNIQLSQQTKIVLVATMETGKKIRRPLDATAEEIMDLLDRFFDQKDNSGLAPYWMGVWQTNYTTWKQLTRCPDRLTSFFDTLSDQDKSYLLKYLTRESK